ncbi:hypothetical protein MMC16_004299 [Acarospora aff. strigata]|nr:hypothetical protein [Acarospora aff. strigata]
MFILSHLIAALASVLPLLLAIQKGRNGDFDFVYQRTIDYTSSFRPPNLIGYLLPNRGNDIRAPVMTMVDISDTTMLRPQMSQTTTELHGQYLYMNATNGTIFTTHPQHPTIYDRYYSAIVEIFRYVLLASDILVRLMDSFKEFSTDIYLNKYDFALTSPSRTGTALAVAFKSVLRSYGPRTLMSSFIITMLIKLFMKLFFALLCIYFICIALGIWMLLRALATAQADLKLRDTTVKRLQARCGVLQHDLEEQVKNAEQRRRNNDEFVAAAEEQHRLAQDQIAALGKGNKVQQEGFEKAQEDAEKLRAGIRTVMSDLEATRKRADGFKKQADILQAKVEGEKRRADAATAIHNNIKKALKEKTSELEDLSAKLEVLTQEAGTHKVAARKLGETLGKLEIDLSTKSSAMAAVQQQLEDTDIKIDQKSAELQQLHIENATLSQEVEKAGTTSQTLREQVTQLEDELRTNKSTVATLRQQLAEKEKHLNGKLADLAALHFEKDKLEENITKADARDQGLRDSVSRLESDLSAKASAVEDFKEQAQHQRHDLAQKSAEISDLKSEQAALQDEIAAAATKKQTLGERVQALEADLNLRSSVAADFKEQAEEQQRTSDQKIAALESENAALREDKTAARQDEQTLRKTLKRVEDELSAKSFSAEAYEKQLEIQAQAAKQRADELTKAHDAIKNLEGQLETLQTQLADQRRDHSSEVERLLAMVENAGEHESGVAETPEVAEQVQEPATIPAAKGGHRRKRKAGGKKRAAKRAPVPRRHSFGSPAHKPCLVCGGPLPVKARFIPKAMLRASGKTSADSRPPPRTRRHSLDSPAQRPCPECGGPLPVKVDCMLEARNTVDSREVERSGAAEITRPLTDPDKVPPAEAPSWADEANETAQQDVTGDAGVEQTGEPDESPASPTARRRRRRRQKARGQRRNANQGQAEEQGSQHDSEAQNETETARPGPSTLSSSWGLSGSSPSKLTPTTPSPLPSRWGSNAPIFPQATPSPSPFPPSPRPAPQYSPWAGPSLFSPYRSPGQHLGFGHIPPPPPNQHHFSPSNTGFAPNYTAGPSFTPGQRPPLFGALNSRFPPTNSPFQPAGRGFSPLGPNRPFNPSAAGFRPSPPFPFPSPNQQRPSGHPPSTNDNNDISKWAD